MKKCDHVKDLILTDYIDGQVDKNIAGEIENHLLDCNDCRVFLKEVKSSVIFPLSQIQRLPVPAELWDRIKQNIEDENQAVSPLLEFFNKLKGLLLFPRMVPVFASFILMFVAGSVTLNTIQMQQAQAKDQGEYLVSLLNPTSTASLDSSDPGTPIEHYFL